MVAMEVLFEILIRAVLATDVWKWICSMMFDRLVAAPVEVQTEYGVFVAPFREGFAAMFCCESLAGCPGSELPVGVVDAVQEGYQEAGLEQV